MSMPCSTAYAKRDCVDLRPFILQKFTPCVYGGVGQCLAAPDEVVNVNSYFIVATGASSGSDRACIVPNTTLVCWKKRPCDTCSLVLIDGEVEHVCTVGSNDAPYTNLQAFGLYELQGNCTSGGGGIE